MPMQNKMSVVIRADGTLVGVLPTSEILSDPSLHLNHSATDTYNATSERTFGGIMDYEGTTYSVMATQLASPIALDLNGDGKIDVTGKATGAERYDPDLGFNPDGAVSFDLHGLGHVGRFEWLQPTGDGFLVDDSKGKITRAAHADGVIDGNDLFGGQRFGNGYAKLAALFGTKAQFASASGDHQLSHGFGPLTGPALKGLKVWIDSNHDAKVQPSELYTLNQLGITEIDAGYKVVTNQKESRIVSSFVRHGKRYMTEDVWFAEDPKDFQR
ncbi:MAG: hypothetical protein KGR26_11480, partial [Cyanobacteria bacterium REEB65]|nr:hypothetical protein [Cyanobacteria bacterium REEB65]